MKYNVYRISQQSRNCMHIHDNIIELCHINLHKNVYEVFSYEYDDLINELKIIRESCAIYTYLNIFFQSINSIYGDDLKYDIHDNGIFKPMTSIILFGCKNTNFDVVTEIADDAFANSGIEQLYAVNIKKIGCHAFESCIHLTNVDLSQCTIFHIPPKCFETCTSLKRIKLPFMVYEIGDHAFDRCSQLEYVNKPSMLHKLGCNVFEYCGVQDFSI